MSREDKPQRVGILVVHGIGEQCQFEHLEEVVRNIASALQADSKQADSNIDSVQVNINISKDAPYRANQQTWRGEGAATAIIEVVDKNDQQTNLEFREVWWSDLDEPNSFKTFRSFWAWGLSLWTKPRYDQRTDTEFPDKEVPLHPDRRLPGRSFNQAKDLLPGEGEPIQLVHRVYLLLVSFVVFLLLPFLWVLGRVSRSILGLEIRPDLLVEYLGDVKLYQQDAREGKGPLVDLGKAPPRFSIRRRFIKALVEMSLEKYERWYILSHSLGTVVAFNGLMEIETALPRYLDQKLWKRWCRKHQGRVKRQLTEDEKKVQKYVLPQRPSWLSRDNDDVISRKELFRNLKGFMTYGSPLSKFAVLWPLVVPLNKDESVFKEDFEWINVFDPTDPVSDFTRFFDSQQGKESPLTPKEVPYKAEQIHLLSHGQYLTYNPKRKNPLVCQVSEWLLSGEKFKKPQIEKDGFSFHLGWPNPKSAHSDKDSPIVSFYFGLGIFVWFLLGVIISFALSWFIPSLLTQVPQLLAQIGLKSTIIDEALLQLSHFLSNPLYCVGIAFCTIISVGLVVRVFGLNKNRGISVESKKP
ncbi:hypothetical protein H6F93_31675 [Leptolyngbya sp. FACHB-671]|uniref:hypothetical protein n=1 Tax=Leptolyngbya sp. FACHB-671 TaxID=2692812 RepID=UPI001686A5E2|nr:hypothetical protein [Leptolyngbya sp. FACHB-671]MBD2072030.1 hypothetical protein [Leptolyngbya sp. FACHB-671]